MASPNPSLPPPILIDGENHIPPPSTSSLNSSLSSFASSDVLPPGKSLLSSWGTTHYHIFQPPTPLPQSRKSRRVLLVHGGGTPAIGLAPLARNISGEGHQVVIYDLWGHGLSSTPLVAHTPALMHAQIFELLSHLKWFEDVNLVGFSLGGAIVATFAAVHGHVIEAVVLIAPAGLWRKEDEMWEQSLRSEDVVLSYFDGDVDAARKGTLQNGEVDVVAVKKWQSVEHRGHRASSVSLWHNMIFDQHASFEKMRDQGTNVLVVLGEEDDILESGYMMKELKAMGWKGEVQVVEGATHEIVRSHGKEVAALCVAFWEKM